MKTKKYKITTKFSQPRNFPAVFVAGIAKETAEAVYVYGHASIDGHTCIRCGHELEGHYSEVGLCYHCLNYWCLDIDPDWKYDFMHMSDTDIGEIRDRIEKMIVDRWIPKATIIEEEDADEEIELPVGHKMLENNKKEDQKETQEKVQKNQRVATLDGEKIIIRFPYDANDVKLVKTISGRTYDPNKKIWSCPVSPEAIEVLEKAGFEIDENLK